MNYTLRNCYEIDSLFRAGSSTIVPVEAGAFLSHFSADRLKAFKTRFVPTRETFGDKFDSLLATIGIYLAVGATAIAVSTANLAPVLHALRLNGV